jgi:hypothetical protein
MEEMAMHEASKAYHVLLYPEAAASEEQQRRQQESSSSSPPVLCCAVLIQTNRLKNQMRWFILLLDVK